MAAMLSGPSLDSIPHYAQIIVHVFVAAITCLPSRRLATIAGNTYSQTDGRDL
jgi:hypothetical protein